ncbi:IS1182 family transposase [Paludibaculum fermentans]|uniref:IS1182 family transposase n=3 Tax=Paludibaculum fermentans TaxID=1473598 RepID=UPI003EC0EFEF
MKRFRPCDLDQPFLLPPSLQDWLPEGHLARFVANVVDALDLSPILDTHARKDGRGKAAYHPILLVRLLVYGYAVGKRSSRQLERATYDEVPFRYLAADQHPDHDTISTFRQVHLQELAKLFLQVLALCRKAGMVQLGQIAIDGSKLAANASQRKSHSYAKLSEREQKWLETVEQILKDAQAKDEQEDSEFGHGRRGDELPADLATAQQQLDRIRAAKKELEEEARRRAEQAAKEKAAQGGKAKDQSQRKRWYRSAKGVPSQKALGNLTDPQSRVMIDGASNRYIQGYNAQIAVDQKQQVIVAAEVTSQQNDRQQLAPMVDAMEVNVQAKCGLIVADNGYWNERVIGELGERGVDVMVPPDGFATWRRTGTLPRNGARGPLATKMRDRLTSEPDATQYKKRSGIVEPLFGLIKELRHYRRFLFRGLEKVRAEWQMICMAMNVWKLHRHQPQVVLA